jgi:hypothetical protein
LSDIGWAVFHGLITIVSADISDDPGTSGSNAPIVIFGALTALHLGSAIYGYSVAHSCREAEAAMEARLHATDVVNEQRVGELERQLSLRVAEPQCSADVECRADRVCDQGQCVSVPPPPPAPPLASPPLPPSSPSASPTDAAPQLLNLTPPSP